MGLPPSSRIRGARLVASNGTGEWSACRWAPTLMKPDQTSLARPNAERGCRLLVVIVNYKSADLAIDCLASLEPELAKVPGARVSLVENASGESEILAKGLDDRGWRGWVSLEEAGRNGGFAAGNNVAIVPALASDNPPRYVLLLNPDTVVRPRGVQELLDFMDAHPEVGIAGSRLENPDGSPQRSAFRFPSVLGGAGRRTPARSRFEGFGTLHRRPSQCPKGSIRSRPTGSRGRA